MLRTLLYRLLGKMPPIPGPSPIMMVVTAQPTSLLPFLDVVAAFPQSYNDLVVEEAVICDTNRGVSHESIVFKLSRSTDDGRRKFLYVVSDRVTTERPECDNTAIATSATSVTPAGSPLSPPDLPPQHSSSQPRLPTLNSTDSTGGLEPPGPARDYVRLWEPGWAPQWWRGALGATVDPLKKEVTHYNFSTSGNTPPLTFIDIVLALQSVSLVSPNYSLARHNCWWFARSVTLLLCTLHQLPRSAADRHQIAVNYFQETKTATIPSKYGLTDQVIEDDVQTALDLFNQLVRKSLSAFELRMEFKFLNSGEMWPPRWMRIKVSTIA